MLPAVLGVGLALRLLLAGFGLQLLRGADRSGARRRTGPVRLLLAGAAAAAVGWMLARGDAAPPAGPPALWVGAAVGALADEIVWRGSLQGALERALAPRRLGPLAASGLAAGASAALAAAALILTGAASGTSLTVQVAAAAARAFAGLPGAVGARLAMLLTPFARGIFS